MKRYRYTGKERDEETGFSYHGARYYAPWIGRWASCDPLGTVDGLNVYEYVHSNPNVLIDGTGMQSKAPSELKPGEIDPQILPGSTTENINLSEMVVTGEMPFEPEISDPAALEKAEGRGHIEWGDYVQFGKGLINGATKAVVELTMQGATGALGPLVRPIVDPLVQEKIPKMEIDTRYEGAAEMGRQLGGNLVYEASGAVIGKLAEVESTAAKVPEMAQVTLGEGKRLPIVNPHFQPNITPHKAAQGAVTKIVEKFENNPKLTEPFLHPSEIDAMVRDPEHLAGVNFGKAAERAMAKIGEESGLMEHIGMTRIQGRFAKSNDLRGVGPYSGVEFQITTWKELDNHLEKHPEALYLLYNIPASWYKFLGL